ncbi:MAG: hypothetical protein L0Z70_11985, partial [Chloroflexi bacterium]|nr:hypothetical protein [Chloroflexota bacterium]
MKAMIKDPLKFAQGVSELKLRAYQQEAAQAIVASVMEEYGDIIVVMFPRQSGKNETQAQVETYLLSLYSQNDPPMEIVKISPTWRPQSLNAMRRLERVLKKNAFTANLWRKESGYIYRVGNAGILFFSGAAEANIVGATASLLLEVDEAQDVGVEKYDKDIAPMGAATNATQVFWGTAWTSHTLLARQLRAAQEQERQDGRRRVFRLTAEQVIQEVPRYRAHVELQVALLGRQHPMVRTQYFSEEIDDESGMFPPRRRALMQGGHPRQNRRVEGRIYALLVDVAGEDEAALEAGAAPSARRDTTALTVVEVDLSTLDDPALKAPTYRVVERVGWLGVRHSLLYVQITALAEAWQARWLVIDATGVG